MSSGTGEVPTIWLQTVTEHGLRAPADQPPIACTPPSTCTISPVVAGNQSESRATHARAAGSWLLRSQPSGARPLHIDSNCSAPGIDRIAIVRSGPAATRLTLIWYL